MVQKFVRFVSYSELNTLMVYRHGGPREPPVRRGLRPLEDVPHLSFQVTVRETFYLHTLQYTR